MIILLASDWNDDNGAVGPLSRKSFELHEELSKELKQEIDYRKLNTLSVCAKKCSKEKNGSAVTQRKLSKSPDWLDGKSSTVSNAQNIGNEDTTAQVRLILKQKIRYTSIMFKRIRLQ